MNLVHFKASHLFLSGQVSNDVSDMVKPCESVAFAINPKGDLVSWSISSPSGLVVVRVEDPVASLNDYLQWANRGGTGVYVMGEGPLSEVSFSGPVSKFDLRAALNKLVDDLGDLFASSEGVAGLHRNGDIATWDEIRLGGRFGEWLQSYDDAVDLLTRNKQEGKP